jgi:hypothetical protein
MGEVVNPNPESSLIAYVTRAPARRGERCRSRTDQRNWAHRPSREPEIAPLM